MIEKPQGWIGVDLDGTLAHKVSGRYLPGGDRYAIGEPIPAMLERVIAWLNSGREVRIFTARMVDNDPLTEKAIRAWTLRHVGCELIPTAIKDPWMDELWDDRAITVEQNTGRILTTCGVCPHEFGK